MKMNKGRKKSKKIIIGYKEFLQQENSKKTENPIDSKIIENTVSKLRWFVHNYKTLSFWGTLLFKVRTKIGAGLALKMGGLWKGFLLFLAAMLTAAGTLMEGISYTSQVLNKIDEVQEIKIEEEMEKLNPENILAKKTAEMNLEKVQEETKEGYKWWLKTILMVAAGAFVLWTFYKKATVENTVEATVENTDQISLNKNSPNDNAKFINPGKQEFTIEEMRAKHVEISIAEFNRSYNSDIVLHYRMNNVFFSEEGSKETLKAIWDAKKGEVLENFPKYSREIRELYLRHPIVKADEVQYSLLKDLGNVICTINEEDPFRTAPATPRSLSSKSLADISEKVVEEKGNELKKEGRIRKVYVFVRDGIFGRKKEIID